MMGCRSPDTKPEAKPTAQRAHIGLAHPEYVDRSLRQIVCAGKYYLPDTFVPPDGLGVEAKPELCADDEPVTTLLPERDDFSCEHIV